MACPDRPEAVIPAGMPSAQYAATAQDRTGGPAVPRDVFFVGAQGAIMVLRHSSGAKIFDSQPAPSIMIERREAPRYWR